MPQEVCDDEEVRGISFAGNNRKLVIDAFFIFFGFFHSANLESGIRQFAERFVVGGPRGQGKFRKHPCAQLQFKIAHVGYSRGVLQRMLSPPETFNSVFLRNKRKIPREIERIIFGIGAGCKISFLISLQDSTCADLIHQVAGESVLFFHVIDLVRGHCLYARLASQLLNIFHPLLVARYFRMRRYLHKAILSVIARVPIRGFARPVLCIVPKRFRRLSANSRENRHEPLAIALQEFPVNPRPYVEPFQKPARDKLYQIVITG